MTALVADRQPRIRPLLAALLLALVVLVAPLASTGLAAVSPELGGPPTTKELPGTTLEADERDDGTTSAAPWVIGSGLAALVLIAAGGTFLKRKQDREA